MILEESEDFFRGRLGLGLNWNLSEEVLGLGVGWRVEGGGER